MKRLAFLSLLVLVPAGLWVFWPEPWELHVLAGQSNAMGIMGRGEHYPADPEQLDGEIPFYYDSPGTGSSGGKWARLSVQEGRFRHGYFGPEVSFARTLRGEGAKVAVFKYTLPTTSLAADWKGPGEGGSYDDLLETLEKAVDLFERTEGRLEIASFTWIQGESDAETAEMAQGFEARLGSLVTHFRRWVGRPDLPVVVGLDEQHPWVREHPEVVGAQRRLAARSRQLAFLSMEGLEKADTSHLTPAGLVEHGWRLAALHQDLRSAAETGRPPAPVESGP